jgi:hypothetical protein
VASRTSSFRFKAAQTDIREIGALLNVATVLEGSVRRSGDRVRVSAQLIDVADGYRRWCDRIDGEMRDILTIEDEIAGKIAAALEVTFAEPLPERAPGRDSPNATRCSGFTWAPDPRRSRGRSGPAGRPSSSRPTSRRRARRVGWRSSSPANSTARSASSPGRWTSTPGCTILGMCLRRLRRDDAARAADLECIESAKKRIREHPDDTRALTMGAAVLASMGEPELASGWVERALQVDRDEPIIAYNAACVYTTLGRIDEAFACLRLAAREGGIARDWVDNDPDLDPLRGDPRFGEL